MDDLPFWLKVLSALATPAIALLGFAIAWGQWTTARSKLILDLFEQRREVYSALLGPTGEAMRQGRADTALSIEFLKIIDRAKFLFGRDVMDYIDEYRTVLNHLGMTAGVLQANHLAPDQRERMLQLQMNSLRALNNFYDDLSKLMIPYMLMDQKRPWTISRIPRWFGWRRRQLKKAAWMRWRQWRRSRAPKVGLFP